MIVETSPRGPGTAVPVRGRDLVRRGVAVRAPDRPATAAARVVMVGKRALLLDGLAAGVERADGLAYAGRWPSVPALLVAVPVAGVALVAVDTASVPAEDVGALRAARPGWRIVLLADGPPVPVELVLDGQADGIVTSTLGAAEAVGTLRQVLAGQLVLPAVTGRPAGIRRDPRAGLSERQAQIVRLAAQGLSNAEIADDLFLSVNTVKFHLRTAYAQLGVRNRVQAALRLSQPTT